MSGYAAKCARTTYSNVGGPSERMMVGTRTSQVSRSHLPVCLSLSFAMLSPQSRDMDSPYLIAVVEITLLAWLHIGQKPTFTAVPFLPLVVHVYVLGSALF